MSLDADHGVAHRRAMAKQQDDVATVKEWVAAVRQDLASRGEQFEISTPRRLGSGALSVLLRSRGQQSRLLVSRGKLFVQSGSTDVDAFALTVGERFFLVPRPDFSAARQFERHLVEVPKPGIWGVHEVLRVDGRGTLTDNDRCGVVCPCGDGFSTHIVAISVTTQDGRVVFDSDGRHELPDYPMSKSGAVVVVTYESETCPHRFSAVTYSHEGDSYVQTRLEPGERPPNQYVPAIRGRRRSPE